MRDNRDDWEVRNDANILIQADKIRKDSGRAKAAADMMGTIAEEAQREKEAVLDSVYPSMEDE